jgi:hypothetical protein
MLNLILLSEIKEKTLDNIEFLFNELGVNIENLSTYGNTLRMACPIHDGDNRTAFSIDLNKGHWNCYTKNCHEDNYDMIGLIRLLLKKVKNKDVSCEETVEWIGSKLNIDTKNRTENDEDIEVFRFVNKARGKTRHNSEPKDTLNPFSIEVFGKNFKPSELLVKKDSRQTY